MTIIKRIGYRRRGKGGVVFPPLETGGWATDRRALERRMNLGKHEPSQVAAASGAGRQSPARTDSSSN
jgi:hypothetical protein